MSIARRVERLEAGEPECIVYEVFMPRPGGKIIPLHGGTPVVEVIRRGDPDYEEKRAEWIALSDL